MGDWWIDETPPRDPPQRTAAEELGRGIASAFTAFGVETKKVLLFTAHGFDKAAGLAKKLTEEDMAALRSVGLNTVRRPRPARKAVQPYEHDPPTNLIYPTSFDSWYREYDQPLKRSQLRVNARNNFPRR